MQKFESRSGLILYFLQGAKRYFALSLVFAALVSLFDMISPKIIAFTVDSVIGNKNPQLPETAQRILEAAGGITALRSHLLYTALAVAAAGGLASLSRFLFRSFNARGAETFVKRMRS